MPSVPSLEVIKTAVEAALDLARIFEKRPDLKITGGDLSQVEMSDVSFFIARVYRVDESNGYRHQLIVTAYIQSEKSLAFVCIRVAGYTGRVRDLTEEVREAVVGEIKRTLIRVSSVENVKEESVFLDPCLLRWKT